MTPHQRKIATVFSKLSAWYANNPRDLPWRRTKDPYAVFVSEIMLQQTQVKTVIPFWERWMQELPTIDSLARASSSKIHKLWEGLGYYTRVRNMQKAAQEILLRHGGKFPTAFEDVLDLPGVGRYTAGAICSIAFNQPRPILDGNVIRVLTRVFGIDGNPKEKKVNARLWELAEQLVKLADRDLAQTKQCTWASNAPSKIANHSSCSQLNQSLMELGAVICTPRQPRCELCPVRSRCFARRHNRFDALPALPARQRQTKRKFVAFVLQSRGRFLVQQRPSGVVNAQLWEFPNVEVPFHDGDPEKAALKLLGKVPSEMVHLCSIQHSITRYRIRLDALRIPSESNWRLSTEPGKWLSLRELHQLPFTSAHKKILARL